LPSIQDELSRKVYHAPGVERLYEDWTRVPIDETMALLKYQPTFVDADVLDLGVGTGRTTRYLAPLARSYQGLDFSPRMVRTLGELLPWASVRLGDMRDLSEFDTEGFDFVMASSNVISAVNHEGRLRVLTEVHRVLRQGGTFMFSSHNRAWNQAGHGPRLRYHRNPFTMLREVVAFARCWANHVRTRAHRQANEEYELLDDIGHDFSLLHYYIDREHAERQLVDMGFKVEDVFHPAGHALPASDHAEDAHSLLYVARKVGSGASLG